MAKAKKSNLPGSIYKNGRRWWWKVRLPGEEKTAARPLSEEDTLDEHPEVAELLARFKQTRESQPKGLENKKQVQALEHQIHEFLMLIAKL